MIFVNIKKLRGARGERFFLDADFNLPLAVRRAVFFGPSGSGKTLALQCVAGLARPDEGKISVSGRVFYSSDEKIFLKPQIRRVGYMPQDYALFPHLTVLQNVAYAGAGFFPAYIPAAAKRRARESLAKFGILELENRKPDAISGGQKQRVALARAANSSPCVLLLDEPFSALDPLLRERMRTEILNLLNEMDIPAIIITHDPEDVDVFAGALVLFNHGKTVAIGDYQKIRAAGASAADCLRSLETSLFPPPNDDAANRQKIRISQTAFRIGEAEKIIVNFRGARAKSP